MKNEVKNILKELNLYNDVKEIEIFDNKESSFYQKVIKISFKDFSDKATIILNAYNKSEFQKNSYTKDIKEQILDQKYLFEKN